MTTTPTFRLPDIDISGELVNDAQQILTKIRNKLAMSNYYAQRFTWTIYDTYLQQLRNIRVNAINAFKQKYPNPNQQQIQAFLNDVDHELVKYSLGWIIQINDLHPMWQDKSRNISDPFNQIISLSRYHQQRQNQNNLNLDENVQIIEDELLIKSMDKKHNINEQNNNHQNIKSSNGKNKNNSESAVFNNDTKKSNQNNKKRSYNEFNQNAVLVSNKEVKIHYYFQYILLCEC